MFKNAIKRCLGIREKTFRESLIELQDHQNFIALINRDALLE